MGSLRLILALSVLFSHIGDIPGFKLLPADVAVNCFFILSGFYMSLGLNEKYKDRSHNSEFYIGRVWRLWPTYLMSIAILIPTGLIQYWFSMVAQLPFEIASGVVFSNLTMVGVDLLCHFSFINGEMVFSEFGVDPHHNGVNFILNLPAWSLSIEIMFYLIAPFVVRSFKRSVIFIAIGLTYCAYLRYSNASWTSTNRVDLYFPYAMTFFGMGMIGYWLSKTCKILTYTNILQYSAFIAVTLLSLPLNIILAIVYLTIAIMSWKLFEFTKRNKLDILLGELAYPIYILQIPVFVFVRWNGLVEANKLSYFLATLFAAIFTLFIVERPIDRFRAHINRGKYLNG